MRVLDARRLTGLHLLLPGAGAAAEIGLDAGEDPKGALSLLEEEVRRLWGRLPLAPDGASDVITGARVHRAGISFAVRAEIDRLYVAVSALERAVEAAAARLGGEAPPSLDEVLAGLSAELEAEQSPALLALREEARRRGAPFLWDDDLVSLGLGVRSVSFPAREIPPLDEIPWARLGSIPVALVTGTNGKTTSTRLVARMALAAGLTSGHTSTDGIIVGGNVVDEGDWTGPGGAREVLRHPGVELAVLETARGGLLRRGLPVGRCEAALVTNVSEDHLGEYGVFDLAGMAEVKALVGHAVDESGRVVLNADDPALVAFAGRYRARVVYFAEAGDNPVVAAHLAAGGEACFVDGDALVYARGHERHVIVRTDEVPITFGGAARHNVQNALGAAALGHALGLPWSAIERGLRDFKPSLEDSPGRANVLEKDGVRLLIDFAHNPRGVAATLGFLATLRARQPSAGELTVITGQAGDRPDEDVCALCRVLVDGGTSSVLVHDIKGYLRGREPGEVPRLFQEALLELGFDEKRVRVVEGEAEGLALALAEAKAGDTVALLVHVEKEPVRALLRERGWL